MVDSINAFRIFGPLEIILQGEIISIESGKLRTLLAALLLDAGSVVGSDRLIDWLWDDHQPAFGGSVSSWTTRRC
jgi:DNA-binding SARP family transcriptional activator